MVFDIQPSYFAFATIFILFNLLRAGASLLIKFKFLNLNLRLKNLYLRELLNRYFKLDGLFF